ncbi:MAG: MGDG synthase family glycosyltransferase [Phycisphaerae bacterium]
MIVTAGVGTGHHAVTRALTDSLRTNNPLIRPRLVEALAFTPRLFTLAYAGGFALSMSRAPWLYGFAYRLSNRPHRPGRSVSERLRLLGERLMLRRFGNMLEHDPPKLIVNTHFLTTPYIAHLRCKGRFTGRQVVVVTDIEAHRYWYSQEVDHYFVPTEYTADIIRRWGIPSQRITVSGIPVHPRWTRSVDRDRVLDEWKLPSDRPIVLLSGGAAFTCGPVVRIARDILESTDAHLVPLAGRNKKLLARFAGLAHSHGRVTPVGFTNRLHELIEVSALMVTKPGGIMTSELLAKSKPAVLLKPVPGHEAGNAEYIRSRGAAVIGRTAGETVAHVQRLLNNPAELERMATAAGELYRPGAQTIATELLQMLSDERQ